MSGSSETGHCSNVSDSGRVCNAPHSSVLFDGIPTLTGLEGDMWASQLLILNTFTSSASITFDFTNPTDKNGPITYAGVQVIEVVMFNCPGRGIGTDNVKVSANGRIADNFVVSDSCSYLVRGCSAAVSITLLSQSIILSFNKIHQHLCIAEISFFSSFSRPCSPVGPLHTSVGIASVQTPTLPSNQENSSNKETIKPYFTTTLQQSISTNNVTSISNIPSSSKTILTQG